jgi:hypothetical protein
MKASRGVTKDAHLKLSRAPWPRVRCVVHQVQKPSERGVLGDLQVVGGQDPNPRSSLQGVLERLVDQVEPRAHDEAHNEVDAIVSVVSKVSHQLFLKWPTAAVKERKRELRLSVCRRACAAQIVALPGDDMTDSTPRIGNVSPVARNDVYVQLSNRLSSCIAGVETDVVTVGGVLELDALLDLVDEREEIAALRFVCLPPGGDHTAGDDESVARANREAVPDRERQPVTGDVIFKGHGQERRAVPRALALEWIGHPRSLADSATVHLELFDRPRGRRTEGALFLGRRNASSERSTMPRSVPVVVAEAGRGRRPTSSTEDSGRTRDGGLTLAVNQRRGHRASGMCEGVSTLRAGPAVMAGRVRVTTMSGVRGCLCRRAAARRRVGDLELSLLLWQSGHRGSMIGDACFTWRSRRLSRSRGRSCHASNGLSKLARFQRRVRARAAVSSAAKEWWDRSARGRFFEGSRDTSRPHRSCVSRLGTRFPSRSRVPKC